MANMVEDVIMDEERFPETEVITIDDDDESVNVVNLRNSGNSYFQLQEYERAAEIYSAAIDLAPEDPITALCYGNRSQCYMNQGKYQEAIQDNEKAGKLDSEYKKGPSRLLRCRTMLGDFAGCEQLIQEQVNIIDGSDIFFTREMEVYYKIKKHKGTAEEKFASGVASGHHDDFRTALFHIEQMIRAGVVAPYCKTFKAECLVKMNRRPEAHEVANSVLCFDKKNVDAIYVRGMCLYYEGKIELAYNELQRVLKLDPDHKKVMTIYRTVRSLKMKREEGNEAFNKRQYQRAYDLYSEALQVDPTNAALNSKLYFNRATVLAKMEKFKESIENCNYALKLDSKYLKALLRRAQCHKDLEEFEDAVKDYEAAYKMDATRENQRLLQDAKIELNKSKHKDYYKILGVKKSATTDEIRKAYKKKALVHHPDRHSAASAEVQVEQERLFKELQEANGVLSDAKRRRAYDNGQDLDGDGMSEYSFHTFYESPHMYHNFPYHFSS